MTSNVLICIHELPAPDCFDGVESEQDAVIHISQECDSTIDFIINDKNLLSGYDRAFVYPVFAFLRSTAVETRDLLHKGQAAIPFFLQQYSFSPNSPRHVLRATVDQMNPKHALVTFQWYPETLKPTGVPSVEEEIESVPEALCR